MISLPMVEVGMGTRRAVCVAVMVSDLIGFLPGQGFREKRIEKYTGPMRRRWASFLLKTKGGGLQKTKERTRHVV